MPDRWRCETCKTTHLRSVTGPEDTFQHQGRRLCCLGAFTKTVNHG